MSGAPSKDDVRGALYSVLRELKDEAKNLVKLPSRLEQTKTAVAAEHVERALTTVARLAEFRLSGAEFAAAYRAEIDCRDRLANMTDKAVADVFRWETIGSVLGSEPMDHEAGEVEYAEAEEILFAEEKGRAILASANIQSAAELKLKRLLPPRMNVETILPEGIAKVSAPPKTGKSWLGLSLVVASASGSVAFGRLPVLQGRALFLGLEDSYRRLQSRLERLAIRRLKQ